MKCYNCGFESPDDFAFCPKCGVRQEVPQWGGDMQTAQSSQAAQRVLTSMKDSLFLAICILFTIGTAIPALRLNFNVINILLTIFLWLAYSTAQKGDSPKEQLRCLSGTVFASYVVTYVICGVMAFCGLIFILLGGNIREIFSEIMSINIMGINIYGMMAYEWVRAFGTAIVYLIGFAFIIGAVVVAFLNYFGTRSIHRFVQSVYMGIDDESIQVVKVNTAGVWLLVFGIFSGFGAVSSLFSGELLAFVSSGAISAAEIIGYVMVKNYYG